MKPGHPYFSRGNQHVLSDRPTWFEEVRAQLFVMLAPQRSEYEDAPRMYQKHKNAVRAWRQRRVTRATRDRRIVAALNGREKEARETKKAARAATGRLIATQTSQHCDPVP